MHCGRPSRATRNPTGQERSPGGRSTGRRQRAGSSGSGSSPKRQSPPAGASTITKQTPSTYITGGKSGHVEGAFTGCPPISLHPSIAGVPSTQVTPGASSTRKHRRPIRRVNPASHANPSTRSTTRRQLTPSGSGVLFPQVAKGGSSSSIHTAGTTTPLIVTNSARTGQLFDELGHTKSGSGVGGMKTQRLLMVGS